ncbi:hypothetical protein CP965_09220 [Halarcobacter mediterraneus]|uniref:VTT domain-containing protein n=1 Tax=Halarcobacter mediterraneus TaxID=2023153 RepID=A0A4V1M196_9BACT|nr:YqaA family protein [Halarcobacter mediterraneus]RXK12745.1 hypothetical protein CP965_09220 [Halarcobacter mediterraneus]
MTYIVLFLSAFLSATLFPFGSEALLIYNLQEGYNVYLLLLFATMGNTLGSLFNYIIGLKGEEYLENKAYLKKEKILKYKKYFDKFGAYCLLFSWLPIIGDPLTFIAGILKYNLKKFIILVVIAKFSRYVFLVFVSFYFLD